MKNFNFWLYYIISIFVYDDKQIMDVHFGSCMIPVVQISKIYIKWHNIYFRKRIFLNVQFMRLCYSFFIMYSYIYIYHYQQGKKY